MSGGLARALATVGGLGDVLPAPGTTVGSLVGLVLFVVTARLAPGHLAAAAVAGMVVLLPVSVWCCGAEATRRGIADPHPVVADEVVGQWLALAVVVVARPRPLGVVALALGFALFRGFDVLKPWPIYLLERLPGGWGIVADDLAAGLAAGLLALAVLVLL